MKPGKAIVFVLFLGGLGFYSWRANREPKQFEPKPVVMAVSEPEALRLLERAGTAVEAVKAIRYHADYQIRGGKKHLTGIVQLDHNHDWVNISVKSHESPDEPQDLYDTATDGKKVVLVSHRDKVYVHGTFPEHARLLQRSRDLLMQELGMANAFEDELKGYAVHEGRQTVGNVECDIVYVKYKLPGQFSRWFFGADGLPRRVERISNAYRDLPVDQHFVQILTLTDLDLQPELAVTGFQLDRPAEYEDIELKPAEPLLAAGTEAPDWQLATPNGGSIGLRELRGQVVVMDFWATWCGPCLIAMPEIQEIHEEFSGRPVHVLGVNCRDEEGDPEKHMKAKDYTYTLGLNGDRVADAYHVAALPTFYVISPDGKIAYSSIGAGSEEQISKIIQELLAAEEPVVAHLGS